jgi:hypothetical protein
VFLHDFIEDEHTHTHTHIHTFHKRTRLNKADAHEHTVRKRAGSHEGFGVDPHNNQHTATDSHLKQRHTKK